MKTKILLLAVFVQFAFVSVFAQFETKLDEELFISKISEIEFIVTHNFPWESNSLIIRASKSEIVLIDTPYDSIATALVLGWIKTNFNPQKITAITTGFHIDNLGGAGCLRKSRIDVYGSGLTVKLIEERGNITRNQIISWLKSPQQDKYINAYRNLRFVKPNRVFKIEEGLNLKIGGLTFEVYYPGESHSPDNVTVYIKELKLLFGGCMIKSKESKDLGFTGDANLAEWPKSVKKIMDKYRSAALVIPHHGMWGDTSLLKHTLDLCNSK